MTPVPRLPYHSTNAQATVIPAHINVMFSGMRIPNGRFEALAIHLQSGSAVLCRELRREVPYTVADRGKVALFDVLQQHCLAAVQLIALQMAPQLGRTPCEDQASCGHGKFSHEDVRRVGVSSAGHTKLQWSLQHYFHQVIKS